jgi:hypothetical protein
MRTREGIRTGLITDNNPLRGLCERVCVEVRRVFDGCITKLDSEVVTVELTDFSITPLPPLTFVSAKSTGAHTQTTNVQITPIGDRGESRVSFDVLIPIMVEFVDVLGNKGVAHSTVVQAFDMVMRVPRQGILPFAVECSATFEAIRGRIIGVQQAIVTCCVVALTRIVAPVDVLVPIYGQCDFEPCGNNSACQELFDRPLFAQVERGRR